MKRKSPGGFTAPEFIGMTVVGERGQVVIPKDVRDELDLKAGSRLIVLRHDKGAIVLIPAEHMQDAIEDMKKRFNLIQDALNN